MTFEEACRLLPEAERKAIETAVRDFRSAALRVFNIETWRQKPTATLFIQDNGVMGLQPRLNWDEPPKPS